MSEININNLQPSQLIELYKSLIYEFREGINTQQSKIRFYFSIVTALLAGGVIAFSSKNDYSLFFSLGLAGLIIIGLLFNARKSLFLTYNNLMETVSMLTKIELMLGMGKPILNTNHWGNEPLLPESYLKLTEKYNTSSDFLKDAVSNYYNTHWIDKLVTFSIRISFYLTVLYFLSGFFKSPLYLLFLSKCLSL